MKKIYMAHSKGQKNYKLFIGDYNRGDFKINGYVIEFSLSEEDFKKIFDENTDQVYEFFGDCHCNALSFKYRLQFLKEVNA